MLCGLPVWGYLFGYWLLVVLGGSPCAVDYCDLFCCGVVCWMYLVGGASVLGFVLGCILVQDLLVDWLDLV